MKRLLRVLLGLGPLLLLWPELARYGAERRLRAATDGFRLLLEKPRGLSDPGGELASVASRALEATGALAGDPRPWVLAGSASLLARQPDRALELYRAALATGERAEIDLNLGRAYAALGRRESAGAAVLRAVWVSPALLDSLPVEASGTLRASLSRLEDALAAGHLAEPPPLPSEERH